MTQAQLLNEFRQLSLSQQLEIIQAALGIVAQKVQTVKLDENLDEGRSQLTEAAHLLLADYLEDEELTSFTSLDGEPFYAAE